MTWGTFGVAHIISIILTPLMGIALFFMLKGRSEKIQTAVLGVLSLSGIAAIIFNLLAWGSPLEYLPLHLCSLSAMILPFAVFFKSRVLSNLLLLWSLGSFFALVLNYSVANAEIFGAVFCFYYFPHVFECIIPLLLFILGHVRLDPRCIVSTLVITVAVFTVIYPINRLINSHCAEHGIVNGAGEIIQVNYMFSAYPDNPLLELFYSVIPQPYWYLYLAIPIIALYLGGIYLADHLVKRKRSSTALLNK